MPAPDEYNSYFQEQRGDEQSAYLSKIAANTAMPPPQLPSWEMINQRARMIRDSAVTAAMPPTMQQPFMPQSSMNFIPGAAATAPTYSPVSVGIPQGVSPMGGDPFANQMRINAVARAHMISMSPAVSAYASMGPSSGISSAFPNMGNFLAPHLAHFTPRNIVPPQEAFVNRGLWEDIQARTGLYLPRETYSAAQERERAAYSMTARGQGFARSLPAGIGRAAEFAGLGMMLMGAPVGAPIAAAGWAADMAFSGRRNLYEQLTEQSNYGALTVGQQSIAGMTGGMPNFSVGGPRDFSVDQPRVAELIRRLTIGKATIDPKTGRASLASLGALGERTQMMLRNEMLMTAGDDLDVQTALGFRFHDMISTLMKGGYATNAEEATALIRRLMDEGVPIKDLEKALGRYAVQARRAGYSNLVQYLIGVTDENGVRGTAGAQTSRIMAVQLGLLGKVGTSTRLMAQRTAVLSQSGMSQQMLSSLGGTEGFTRSLTTANLTFVSNYQEALAACVSYYNEKEDRWVPDWDKDDSELEKSIIKLIHLARTRGLQGIMQTAAEQIRNASGGQRASINAKARLTMDAPIIVGDMAVHPRFSDLIDAIMEGMQSKGTMQGLSKSALASMIFRDPNVAKAYVEGSRVKTRAGGEAISSRKAAAREMAILGGTGEIRYMRTEAETLAEEGGNYNLISAIGREIYSGRGEGISKEIRDRQLAAWKESFKGQAGMASFKYMLDTQLETLAAEERANTVGMTDAEAKRRARLRIRKDMGGDKGNLYDRVQSGKASNEEVMRYLESKAEKIPTTSMGEVPPTANADIERTAAQKASVELAAMFKRSKLEEFGDFLKVFMRDVDKRDAAKKDAESSRRDYILQDKEGPKGVVSNPRNPKR